MKAGMESLVGRVGIPYAEIMHQICVWLFKGMRNGIRGEWGERHIIRGFNHEGKHAILVSLKGYIAHFAIGITPVEDVMLY